MIKIRANEELFNKIKYITEGLNSFLPAIVQNDMEVTEDEIEEFTEKYTKMMDELEKVMEEVNKYVMKGEER